MTSAREPSRIAAALDYLRSIPEHFEFDDQERVVQVDISAEAGGDEIAAHVGHLVDLRSLTFYRSDLTDEGLRHLAGLVNLRELRLYGPKITAAGIAWLGGMSHLEGLSVIAELPELARLGLKSKLLTDKSAAIIAQCQSLQYLGLFKTSLTRAGREMLRDALPGCEIRDLETGRHSGPGSDVG